MVRGLGPRVPLRRAGADRPRFREAAADLAAARVVHAPEWAAARVRMGLRRRQPTRARLGGTAGVSRGARAHRARGSAVSGSSIPEAAAELHVVGESEG